MGPIGVETVAFVNLTPPECRNPTTLSPKFYCFLIGLL
jgi:hypothetical protein